MSCPDLLTAVGGCADKPSRPAEPVADRYRDSGQHRSCPAGTSGPLSISWGLVQLLPVGGRYQGRTVTLRLP